MSTEAVIFMEGHRHSRDATLVIRATLTAEGMIEDVGECRAFQQGTVYAGLVQAEVDGEATLQWGHDWPESEMAYSRIRPGKLVSVSMWDGTASRDFVVKAVEVGPFLQQGHTW